MPRIRAYLIASSVATLIGSAPAAAQFSNMYFVGDSSTDAGFYNGARFTVNPGLVWAQVLGNRYGINVTSVAVNGTDYAQGGSRISADSGLVPPGAPQRSMTTQITQLLGSTGGALDRNALYGVSGGYNDLLENVAAAGAGQITPAQLQANIATAAAQEVQQVARLQAAGAKYVVVLNLYNMGQSPLGTAQPTAPFTALTGLYNSTLNAGLDQIGGNVIRVNTQQLFVEMLANPALFGLSNTSKQACTTSSALTCTNATLVAPDAASTYLFADGIHPTPVGFSAMAQVVGSMIEGPYYMASLAEAPLAVEQANFRVLDGRMWSALDTPGSGKTLQSWISYDYAAPDVSGNAFLSGDGSMNTIAGGLDLLVSPSLLAGIAFGYSENKVDFGGNAGSFKLDETSMTAYLGYGNGPWYVGGSLLLGDLDYKSIERNIALGTGTRTESADANGYTYAIRALGGYWFKTANILHGPFLKFVWQEAKVRQFSETGASSTALTYGQQTRESAITSLGWQVQGTFGAIRPFGRATWEWEAKDDQRWVNASSVTLGGNYSVPAYKPDNNWGLFLVGASADFGGVTGYLSGSVTAGKGDGDSYAITVGLRVPL